MSQATGPSGCLLLFEVAGPEKVRARDSGEWPRERGHQGSQKHDVSDLHSSVV